MPAEGAPWSGGSRRTPTPCHQALGEDLQDPRAVPIPRTAAGTWSHVTFFSVTLMRVRRSHVVSGKEFWLLISSQSGGEPRKAKGADLGE